MREQVSTPTVGNRSGIAAKRRPGEIAQRPLRRSRGVAGGSLGARLHATLSYLPLLLRLVLAISVGVLLFSGYRAGAADSFFQIQTVDVQGNFRASAEDVQKVVLREVGRAGVWQADVKQISARLERLPWIRSAVVSRVLPDGIRVRLAEREPRAVVRTAAGRFIWVDQDAVMLGDMLPTDQMPAFFLRGWNEEEGEIARKENVERIAKFLELEREWNVADLSKRVSEVNIGDIRDVRAQLAGDDSQIEVRLGSQDVGKRLRQALNILDKQRHTPRGPFVSYVDLAQGKGAIVGFISAAHTFSEGFNASTSSSQAEEKKGHLASRAKLMTKRSSSNPILIDKNKKDRLAKANRNEKNSGERPRRARPAQ